MMKRKGLIILFSLALVLLLGAPGWAAFNVECIPGLEIGGYIRNQTDIRAASPQDIMRFATSIDTHFDYKPTPNFQFYLELRPFVDSAYDMSHGLSNTNRGIMDIDNADYSWKAHAPSKIGRFGYNTEVGGFVDTHDVLSTNVNTPYWRYNSMFREGWTLYQNPNWQIKVGKQIVTWGETDGLKLLDFINATDYSHFIIDSMEDSKIPQFMTNITYYFTKDYNLQFIWIPFYTQNFQAPAGSAWALDGVNLIYAYDHFDALNLYNNIYGSLDGAPPAIRKMIAKNACTIDYDDPNNQNEFAGRFKGVIGTNTDYTLNFFYTHDKNNVFIDTHPRYSPWLASPSNPSGISDIFQFRTSPEIQRIYGGSFNHVFDNFLWVLKDLVMRGECAYYYKTDFFGTYKNFNYFPNVPRGQGNPFDPTSYEGGGIGQAKFGLSPGGDLFITKRDLLRLCIGWDKNAYWMGHAWLLSLQTFWEHIFDYPPTHNLTDPGVFVPNGSGGWMNIDPNIGKKYKSYISNVGLTKAYQDEITWTFFINTDFMNQRIKPEDLLVYNAMQQDGWNRFKVTFDISDHWSFAVGNNFFWGPNHAAEPNAYVGNASWFAGAPPGVPLPTPYNPDTGNIGNIRRGGPLGEMQRNTEFFMDLKYLF
jgi:hypothetical protein